MSNSLQRKKTVLKFLELRLKTAVWTFYWILINPQHFHGVYLFPHLVLHYSKMDLIHFNRNVCSKAKQKKYVFNTNNFIYCVHFDECIILKINVGSHLL